MDKATTTFWTLRRKVWGLGGALLVLAFTFAGHYLPDLGLRYGLIRTLRELGWARVSVSAADLSLFNGAIVVRRVEAGEELGRALGIDGVDLKFRWKPLFSRRVSVERLDLQGVAIDIHREGANYVVNGLPVALGAGAGGSDWSYDITTLTLTGSRIDLTDGALKAVIQVDALEIADLKSWEPANPVHYRLTGRLNGTPITVEGKATPFAAVPHLALSLSLDGLDLAPLAELVRRAGGDRLTGRLSAQVRVDGSAESVGVGGKLGLKDAAFTGGATKLEAGALDLELARVHWDGAKLALAGTATAAGLSLDQGGLRLSSGQARLEARAASYDPDRDILSWDGRFHAERHALAVDGMRFDHGSLDWTGATRLNLAADAKSVVHAEGKAETTEFRLRQGDLALEARRLTAEGVFEDVRPETGWPISGHMDVAAEQVWLREPGQDWLHADSMEARELRLAAGGASLARLEVRKLAALAKPGDYPWRLEARHAVMERASLGADGAVAATSVVVNGILGRITRTKAGLLGLPQGGNGGEARMLALGKLRLGGGTRVEFEDRTLSEPVRLRLDGVEFSMVDMDSARPDRDSAFTAKARLGAAHLAATGRARPFAVSPSADMKGEVRALELPPLSPYAADSLGVHLQTGQVDAEIALSASQGKLDGAMQLSLAELFIAQPDPNAPLAKRADMPVETVLDLLRDSDNRIHLSIPVRGDLGNPDFDVSDAVGQAVGGALRSTVFTTLKVAFPLAGLISLVIDDAESRRLALEPLTFHPGADSLGEAERKRLAAVAGLMVQRPGLKLTLCGAALKSEWAALVQRKREEELGLLAKIQKLVGTVPKESAETEIALAELADARAQAAKTYLVDQAGIDPGRLFTCRPRVEADAKAQPRVDLVL